MAKKIAIIGAGASGLTAIKSCIDEGLEPVCFERTEESGGMWNYKEKVVDGQSCVMRTTVINTSKEVMCFSDFPIPAEFPNFMHNTKLSEYFQLYAKKFSLNTYIRYTTNIEYVSRAPDFEKTGQWNLKIKDVKTGSVTEEVFDGVLVCTGHHADKNMPHFPGEEEFQGKRVHTHDYRDHKGFEGKRVVVIGIGNSGGDVAVDLSKICSQVYLSTRRGAWVINRIGDRGVPQDMSLLGIRRCAETFKGLLPRNVTNTIAEGKLNGRFDHGSYGLKPSHRFDAQHPMVNDELPNRIAAGTIQVRPNIKHFTKTGVEFEDGTVEDDIDVVVYATGFIFGFPFMEKEVIDVKDNKVTLFKFVFPPDLKRATIAFIGFFQPWGAINPISELQCRWATRVFKGLAPLPSQEEMHKNIQKKKDDMAERYVESTRHTVQVDWIPFMDEIAEQFGAKPDLWAILKSDPTLWWTCFFGPCAPYQYRLTGPGKWTGARNALMTVWDRTYKPYQTRKVKVAPSTPVYMLVLGMLAVLFLAMLLKWLLNIIT